MQIFEKRTKPEARPTGKVVRILTGQHHTKADESGIIIDSTADPSLYNQLTLRGHGIIDLIGPEQGFEAIRKICKAKHTGERQTIVYTAGGRERLGMVWWRNGAAQIYSMWADEATDHKQRILSKMAG